MIRSLSMAKSTKIALAAVLCLSLFAFAASIVKTVENANLSAVGDFTYNVTKLEIWIIVEINVVILTASAPTIRPFFVRSKRGTGSGYYDVEASGRRALTNRSNGLALRSNSHVSGSNRDKHGKVLPVQNGGSEEYILRTADKSDITRTTDVQIYYE
ncbi:MAG: hypothetical protein Q9165_004608 [Trypethelium subeluteriae]